MSQDTNHSIFGKISLFYFLSPLRFFLSLLARPRSINNVDVIKNSLKKDANVLYIIENRSFCDYLVLYNFCVENELPLPKRENICSSTESSFMFLNKVGMFQTKPAQSEKKLDMVLDSAKKLKVDTYYISVSILWGRRPKHNENSILKLFFPDDKDAGFIHKFFIVLAQGRDLWLSFSTPKSLNKLISEQKNSKDFTSNMVVELKHNFNATRSLILGPSLYDRSEVIDNLMERDKVVEAIRAETTRKSGSFNRVQKKMYDYFTEMAADQSYSVLKAFRKILNLVLSKLFYEVKFQNIEAIQKLYQDNEIIYLPTHRSYFDFLAFPAQLHTRGFNVPHIAAGKNLNFWLIGSIFRKCGAFFIRRSFKGDRLYKVAFYEYLQFLLRSGCSILFFPEGKRSRTGKSLKPKTGLLAMVVLNYLINKAEKPLAFLPIYIGYDSIVEINSYIKENQTDQKEPESFTGMLKAWKVLKRKYGNIYISCSDPIYLDKYLDENVPNWRNETYNWESKPEWFSDIVTRLAFSIMNQSVHATCVSPSSVLSYALLSIPQHAIPEKELCSFMDNIIKIIKLSKFKNIYIQDEESYSILKTCEELLPVKRFSHADGDIIYLDQMGSLSLSYYANNILPLMTLPSLVSSFFVNHDRVSKKDIKDKLSFIYRFLCSEVFLEYNPSDIDDTITLLTKIGLLIEKEEDLYRPDSSSPLFSQLVLLGRSIGSYVERHSIFFTTIHSLKGSYVKRDEIIDSTYKTVRRVFLLKGLNSAAFSSKEENAMYSTLIDHLIKEEILIPEPKQKPEDPQRLFVTDKIDSLFSCYESIVSKDIRYNLDRDF